MPNASPRSPGAAAILAILSLIPRPASGDEPKSDVVIRTAIDAILANDRLIQDGTVRTTTTVTDRSVTKPETIRSETDGGLVAALSRAPETRTAESVTFRGGDVLARIEGRDGSCDQLFLRRGDTWKVYTRSMNRVQIVDREGLPDRIPVDPREIGSGSIRSSLIDRLNAPDVAEAAMVESAGARIGRVVRIVKTDNGVESRTIYEFSPEDRFLLRRAISTVDGRVVSILDLNYQDVLDGRAKFLKSSSLKFYAPKSPLEALAPETWHQEVRVDVEELTLNQDVDDEAFDDLSLPKDVEVFDSSADRP